MKLFLLTAWACLSALQPELVEWFDPARNRQVPVALYHSQIPCEHPRLVVLSHGYGQNRGGDYLVYAYLSEHLAERGYFVASVQHELADDELLPMEGVLQQVRRPFWERGADNIRFVIETLRTRHPELDFQHIALIGHSNGGDSTALFPQKYPDIVEKIITLDNRRMPLPIGWRPRVYSLRSSDQPADPGVLPAEVDRQKYAITIIQLPATNHNQMDDDANPAQRREINDYLDRFLQDS